LKNKYRINAPIATNRIDERDTMFARRERRPNTPQYIDYYNRYPELQEGDDKIRSLTPLLKPGGKYYHSQETKQAMEYFDSINYISPDQTKILDYAERLKKTNMSSALLKKMILELGSVDVGFTALNQESIYTFKGRFDKEYGKPINLEHTNAIVFLVEMDFNNMQKAPRAKTLVESARQYYKAAEISMLMTAVLQSLGYAAKAHYDAHYDVMLPPLAVKSGLGELGRNNILIADKYGSRVRIGAITTNLPLQVDNKVSLGADHFCSICKKCAENCPSNALSNEEKVNVRGTNKWPTDVERCYTMWLKYGTDCGICMACCPFSHRNNWFHNFIRLLVRSLPSTHKLLFHLDNLFYGKGWKH
jgi:reductive dehalogenase